tara:strand:- start:383 stop:652 length:270 start_codon:yes stop_codon:yes gene_type:complete
MVHKIKVIRVQTDRSSDKFINVFRHMIQAKIIVTGMANSITFLLVFSGSLFPAKKAGNIKHKKKKGVNVTSQEPIELKVIAASFMFLNF